MPIAPEYLHLVYPGPFTAYLYGRASRDPKKRGRSVSDQLHEGRATCAERSWEIVGEFRDDDRSASRHARKKRGNYDEMIAGVEAGKCRIVVAWEASRYYRDLEAYVRLRGACAAGGVLLCYNGTIYDLSKREDRKATAMDALQAEDEAEAIRDRNLRTARRLAEQGLPHGRLLWGYARRYDPDTGELIEQYEHPERGPIVREIFERVAAGETEYRIIESLNERAPREDGIPWAYYHLSAMLRNPGYIGRRVHHGKDVGVAQWPAIVSEETYFAVQRIVRAPERNTVRDRSIKHLLSGVARCGECADQPHLKVLKNRGYLSYQCSQAFDTVMRKERLDAYVEEAVVAWLGSEEAVRAFQDPAADGQAAEARVRLDRLSTQLAEARAAAGRFTPGGMPELSIASLGALEGQLGPQIEQARVEAETVAVPPLLRGLAGRPDVDTVWNYELVIEQRRAVLRQVVNIRLNKARARGVRSIEPGRVKLVFVGQPGFKGR